MDPEDVFEELDKYVSENNYLFPIEEKSEHNSPEIRSAGAHSSELHSLSAHSNGMHSSESNSLILHSAPSFVYNNSASNKTHTTKQLIHTFKKDIKRFSKLHEWHRYLPLEGREYLIFPWKGQQPKNTIDNEITDANNLHWWFWDSAFIDEIPISGTGKDIIMRRPVAFNCFLRGVEVNEYDGIEYEKGWAFIQKNYPNVEGILNRRYPRHNGDILYYYREEQRRQMREALLLAKEIIELLQSRAPIWLDKNSWENIPELGKSTELSCDKSARETSSTEDASSSDSTDNIAHDVNTILAEPRAIQRRTIFHRTQSEFHIRRRSDDGVRSEHGAHNTHSAHSPPDNHSTHGMHRFHLPLISPRSRRKRRSLEEKKTM